MTTNASDTDGTNGITQLQSKQFSRRALLATVVGSAALVLAGCANQNQAGLDSNTSPSTNANGANQGGVASELPPAPKKDHPAPNFTLATLDGGEITLSALQGKPIILNFWASWCGPCRLEMPHLQETHDEQGQDVVVLGVNLTQRENSLTDIPVFVDEFSLTFPIALDENGDVAKLYEVRGQPASVFINADGTIHTVFYGPVTKNFIQERILELKS